MSQPTKQTPLDFFGYQTKFNTQNWNKKEIKTIIEKKTRIFSLVFINKIENKRVNY